MSEQRQTNPTKSVDGEELPASAFAYVGDPKDISTWHLPIHDCPHALNALARFNQTSIPANHKHTVAQKIATKAKHCGYDVTNFEDEHGIPRSLPVMELIRTRLKQQRELRGIERRECGSVEFRADPKAPQITMFIPYRSRSVDMGFTEMIAPGAFTRSIDKGRSSERADVVALWNHDSSQPLARQANRTLEFTEGDDGLTAVAILNPEIDYHRQAMEVVRSGLVRGSSFGFDTVRDKWSYADNGDATRTLEEVKLYDVSPVTYPAYPESEAEVRSIAAACGYDPSELLALLKGVRNGKVPQERREALQNCIARLSGFLPAEPIIPTPDDYDYRLQKIAIRERLKVA